MPFPEEGLGPQQYPATESFRDRDSQEGRTAAIVGGVIPIGDVRNCLFYGLEHKAGTPHIQFGPADGIAMCPISKIKNMAVRHVSVDDMLYEYEARELWRHLWRRALDWFSLLKS